MSTPAGSNGSHRLQSFSDAVFAFACTLLVVSLEVPRNYAELRADLQGFVAFGLAFAVLIYIWSAHHRLFRRFPLDSNWTVLLNSALLFVVLFFVYPLKFLAVGLVASLFGIGAGIDLEAAGPGAAQELFFIYGGAYAAVFGLLALLYLQAAAQSHATADGHSRRGDALAGARHYLIMVGIALLSMAVNWLGWGLKYGLPGWLYMLIGPAAWLNGVLAHRGAEKPPI